MKINTFFVLAILLIISCNRTITKNNGPFKIKEGFLQSWMNSKNENGTIITLHITDVNQNVRFDSIIYDHIQIPVETIKHKSFIELTGNLRLNSTRLHMDVKQSDKPNQLIYSIDNSFFRFNLDTLKHRKMKYFR